MKRTIKSLLDAYIQHLAANGDRLWMQYRAGKPIDVWLRRELVACVDYLRDVNKFRNLLEPANRSSNPGAVPGDGSADLFVEGRTANLRMAIGYFSTEGDLAVHLEDIREDLEYLKHIPEPSLKLWLELIASRGKWAHRTIGDCLKRLESTFGIRLEPYAPTLRLVPRDASRNLLDAPVVLQLSCSYIGDQSLRKE